MSIAHPWVPLSFVLAVLAGSAAQSPQPPEQPPVFRTGVELVQVEVVVTDADGRPVHGLTKGDFALRDRRRPQTIAVFDEIRHERPDAELPFPPELRMDVADNRDARSERLVILVLDDYNTWKERSDQVKAVARDLVHRFAPRASMSILFTSRTGGTEVTRDRGELLAAVERFKGHKMVRRPGTWGGGGGLAMVRGVAPRRTLADLARVVRSHDQHRKAFVFVSETPPAGGTSLDVLDAIDAGDFNVDYRLSHFMREIHRSNIALYTIDPRGSISEQDLGRECFPAPVAQSEFGFDRCAGNDFGQLPEDGAVRRTQRGIEVLAETGGGFGIVNTDDFAGGVDRIVSALDNYYMLGFYPTNPRGSGLRLLSVSIPGRPDLTVQYRRAYARPEPAKPPKRPDPVGELYAGVLPTTDLPVRVFAAALPTGSKDARVIVSAEITAPRGRLVQPNGTIADTVQLGVLAGDMNVGRVRRQVRRTATVSARPDTTGVPDETVTYQVNAELALRPGRYQIRASALSAALGTGGSVYLPLDIPDFRKPATPLGNVVLGHAGRAPAAGEGAHDGLPLQPTLDRTFAPERGIRVYFEVARDRRRDEPRARLEIIDASNAVRQTRDVNLRPIDASRAHGDETIDLQALEPGHYRIRVVVTSGLHTAERLVGISVASRRLRPSSSGW